MWPVVARTSAGVPEAVREVWVVQRVDHTHPAESHLAILDALAAGEKRIPRGLDYFSYENFERRTHAIIDELAANA